MEDILNWRSDLPDPLYEKMRDLVLEARLERDRMHSMVIEMQNRVAMVEARNADLLKQFHESVAQVREWKAWLGTQPWVKV